MELLNKLKHYFDCLFTGKVPLWKQRAAIKAKYPDFFVYIDFEAMELLYTGTVRPTPHSPKYRIAGKYKWGQVPKAYVIGIPKPKTFDVLPWAKQEVFDAMIQLLYKSPIPEYWLISISEYNWVDDFLLVETYIPWTVDWLKFYEIWLSTGKWDGKEFPESKLIPVVSSTPLHQIAVAWREETQQEKYAKILNGLDAFLVVIAQVSGATTARGVLLKALYDNFQGIKEKLLDYPVDTNPRYNADTYNASLPTLPTVADLSDDERVIRLHKGFEAYIDVIYGAVDGTAERAELVAHLADVCYTFRMSLQPKAKQ